MSKSKKKSIDNIRFKDGWKETSVSEWWENENGRKFSLLEAQNAMNALAAGVPIKRVSWIGYWQFVNGRIEVHGDIGTPVNAMCMLAHGAQDDWIPLNEVEKKRIDYFLNLAQNDVITWK